MNPAESTHLVASPRAPETAPATAVTPRLTLQDEALQRTQRRLAVTMILVPPIGVMAAITMVITTGITIVEIVIFLVMYALTTIGVTVGFHRQFAHRSYEARQSVRIALAILGSMAIQGPLIFWVATHRRHHQFSDSDGDPHSPNLHGEGWKAWLGGFWYSHIRWLYAGEITNSVRFANDLRHDKAIVWINNAYPILAILGLVLPSVAGALLIGGWMGTVKGFLWGGMVRLFVVHHAFWSIGSFAHTFGSHPYRTDDHSGNSFWLAIPNFGEGWHNNHHAFPSSAFFGLEWWQLDIGGLVISALRRLGGIKNPNSPTPEQKASKRRQQTID